MTGIFIEFNIKGKSIMWRFALILLFFILTGSAAVASLTIGDIMSSPLAFMWVQMSDTNIIETITNRGPGVLSSTINFLLRWCHGWIPTAESVPPIIIQHFRSHL
jgi:hypothetical protein